MFDLITIIVSIFGISGAIITVIVGIRTLRKRPRITFSLKKVEISLNAQEHEEKVTLLLAPVGNEKQRFTGDVAKKVSGMVLYRAPIDDGTVGLNASIDLPWIKTSFGASIRTVKQLKSEEDIQLALEEHLFDRKERDIPQGR